MTDLNSVGIALCIFPLTILVQATCPGQTGQRRGATWWRTHRYPGRAALLFVFVTARARARQVPTNKWWARGACVGGMKGKRCGESQQVFADVCRRGEPINCVCVCVFTPRLLKGSFNWGLSTISTSPVGWSCFCGICKERKMCCKTVAASLA